MIYLCCYLNVRQFGEVTPLAKLPHWRSYPQLSHVGEVDFRTLQRFKNVTSPFTTTLHTRVRVI